MKRFSVIKEFSKILSGSDVVIFSGKEMCKEAYQYDRSGYFYIDNYFGVSVSFALGIALCTDRRIFVFVGEGDLLRELAVIGQIAASKCKNIFIVVLDNGGYQHAGNFPNIFDMFLSKKGVFYNMGCLVHDFTTNLKNKHLVEVKAAVERIRGPMVILIEVEFGLKRKLDSIKSRPITRIKKLIEFLNNSDMKSSLYTPPIWFAIPDQKIKSINIGEIGGGNS